EGGDPARVEVLPLSGCRIGRVRRDAASGIVVGELLLGHTLRPGETHILEYEYRDSGGAECTDCHRGVRSPTSQLALRVRFAPEAVPARCHAYTQRYLNGPYMGRTELFPGPHRSVHVVGTDAPAGILGIRWEWA